LIRPTTAVAGREIIRRLLPHGVSGRYVHEARAGGKARGRSLGRLRLSPDAVYGLTNSPASAWPMPSWWRIRDAIHAALLALIPLAQLGLIDPAREFIIDRPRRA